ncbi:MAG TPA: cellulase N-terminal Ig-like domain-containing protein, partial [Cellvibrionaceae bacterium]|nr:cellulase N-terminal Ig-like domain-containing protein [Cellvibrionaceae bacterium]
MNIKKIAGLGTMSLLASLIAAPTMAANILQNGAFDGNKSSPWEFGAWESSKATLSMSSYPGRACINVTSPGAESWMVQFRQNSMKYIDGRTYTLTADVWSSKAITLKVDGSDETGGYVWQFGNTFAVSAPLAGSPQKITAVFSNKRTTDTGKLAFLLGNTLVPADTVVCLDNIVLDDPQATGTDGPKVIPVAQVKVNQHAYLPTFAKKAVFVVPAGESASQARTWELRRGSSVITSGQTVNVGLDAASGDNVQTIDFSSISTEADDYTLVVKSGSTEYTSQPFAISADAYKKLKYEALSYFYHNRASTPILASVVGDTYARAAGHPDNAVQTAACASSPSSPDCATVDVSGGWY